MQPKTQKTEELEAKFNELAEQIRRDTGFSSHIADRVKHPAYQEVVGMGEAVLPLIFRLHGLHGRRQGRLLVPRPQRYHWGRPNDSSPTH